VLQITALISRMDLFIALLVIDDWDIFILQQLLFCHNRLFVHQNVKAYWQHTSLLAYFVRFSTSLHSNDMYAKKSQKFEFSTRHSICSVAYLTTEVLKFYASVDPIDGGNMFSGCSSVCLHKCMRARPGGGIRRPTCHWLLVLNFQKLRQRR